MFCKSFSFRRHVLRILLLINHSCYSSPLRITNLTNNWFPVLPCNNLFPEPIPWLVYLFEFTIHHSINCIFPQINLSFCHDVPPNPYSAHSLQNNLCSPQSSHGFFGISPSHFK